MSNPLMVINIDHLINNVKVIEAKTKTKIMAIVKSDAYGLGARFITKALVRAGVKYLVVNTAEEAKDLLKNVNLEEAYLLILASLKIFEIKAFDHLSNIIFSVNNIEDASNLFVLKNKHLVHLAIDTGMNRTGCKSSLEIETIFHLLSQNEHVILDGIYTHFASSEKEYEYYQYQRDNFKKYTRIYPFQMIHSANSASLGKPLVGNYVRIGIALYGYNSNIKGLKPVVYLYAKPINLIKLDAGEAIGYDMTYRASSEVKVAVLPLGYNEGLSQGIKNITWKHGEAEYQQIAKTCMNHSYLLVDDQINYRSRFNLLGNNDKIYKIARDLSCAVHQVLCQMSKIKKIYYMRKEYDISKTYRLENFKGNRKGERNRSDLVSRFRIIRAN